MSQQPMEANTLVALLVMGLVFGGAALISILSLAARFANRAPVNHLARPSLFRYVKPDTIRRRMPELPTAIRQEARPVGSLVGSSVAALEALVPSLHITEKALHGQLQDAYEQGALAVYAVLLRGGFLATPVKLEALKTALNTALEPAHGRLFPLAGGALTRFNAAVASVPVEPLALSGAPTSPARPPLQVAAGRPDGYALNRESGDRIDELRAEPAP